MLSRNQHLYILLIKNQKSRHDIFYKYLIKKTIELIL